MSEAQAKPVVHAWNSADTSTATTGHAPNSQKRAWGGAVACLSVSVALIFILPDYQLFQMTMVVAYAIALMGLNLLTGYNGQISLGHGAFFAIGAYATGILMSVAAMPYWLTVPAAALTAFLFGYLFGRPALKLEGLYLALATFALGVALPQLLKYKLLEPWTGGVQGLVLTKPDAPFGLKLSPDQWLYAFAVVTALLMFWLAANLLRGGAGRAIRAIRDHSMAAQAMGVNAAHYKSLVFGISAAFTGVGGALSAIAVQFVSPDSFTLFLSISLLVGIVVGGVGTIWGPVFGAFFIMFVPSMAEQISKSAPWAVYGCVLIAVVFVMPRGVAGLRVRKSVLRGPKTPASTSPQNRN